MSYMHKCQNDKIQYFVAFEKYGIINAELYLPRVKVRKEDANLCKISSFKAPPITK